MNRSISLPDSILRQAEELAAGESMSLEDFVSAAVLDYISGIEYLRRRANRAMEARFRDALAQIPDVDPDPRDRLPRSRS